MEALRLLTTHVESNVGICHEHYSISFGSSLYELEIMFVITCGSNGIGKFAPLLSVTVRRWYGPRSQRQHHRNERDRRPTNLSLRRGSTLSM